MPLAGILHMKAGLYFGGNVRNPFMNYIDISSEIHLERYIINNWRHYFNFKLLAFRQKISSRSIVDMLGMDDENLYLIELKYRPFRKRDISQIRRYRNDLLKIYTYDKSNIICYHVGYNHISGEILICHIKI